MEKLEEIEKFNTKGKYKQEVWKPRSTKTRTQGQEGPTQEKGFSTSR